LPTARKSYFANPGRSFQIYLVSERVTGYPEIAEVSARQVDGLSSRFRARKRPRRITSLRRPLYLY